MHAENLIIMRSFVDRRKYSVLNSCLHMWTKILCLWEQFKQSKKDQLKQGFLYKDECFVTLNVHNIRVEFKVDTGSQANQLHG